MTSVIAIGYRPWSHVDRSGVNVRDLHLALELAKRDDIDAVLYVSRPVSVAEQLVRRMSWRLAGGRVVDQCDNFQLIQVTQSEKVFSLTSRSSDLVAPITKGRAWWDEALANRGFLRDLSRSIGCLGISDPALLSWTPFAPTVFANVPHAKSVFDVIDNFAIHARVSRQERAKCMEGYAYIGNVATSVTCVSERAGSVFRGTRAVPQVLRNGVPREWMSAAPDCPVDLAKLRRSNIVGCGGYFFEKFRTDILIECARRMPETDFVLLGVILDKSIQKKISVIPNIHFLGFRKYEVLSAYYYHFDAGLILYDMKRENDGDPLKLYEYLAVGTPVVSLPSMGVAPTPGAVAVVGTAAEMEAALCMAFDRPRQERRATCRATIDQGDFWDSKAAFLASLLHS